MEFHGQKRLLKPTPLTQQGLKAQLQICKFILHSKMTQKIKQITHQSKQLKQRLLQLQWKYTEQTNKRDNLLKISPRIKQLQKTKKSAQMEIKQITKQIQQLKQKKDKISKKIKDRQQSKITDNAYLNKLKQQNTRMQNQVNNITADNLRMEIRRNKADVFINQMFGNNINLENKQNSQISFRNLFKQKKSMKQKLSEKSTNLDRRVIQLYNNKRNTRLSLQTQTKQLQQNQKNLSNLQQNLEQKLKTTQSTNLQIKKLQRNLIQQNNFHFQLQTKLKITKQNLDKQIKRNNKLIEWKQQIQTSMKQILMSNMEFQKQVKIMEQVMMFQVEYVNQIINRC